MSATYEELARLPSLGRTRAVQHRRRRLRQASARQSGDDLGELRRDDAGARLGRAAGPRQPGGVHARARGIGRATASPSCCRRRPRRRRSSSAPGSSARSCSRCRCCTATTGSSIGSTTPAPGSSSPMRTTRLASTTTGRPTCWCSTRTTLAGGTDTTAICRRHGRRRSGAALLHLRHDRAREGHRPRAPLHPRPRGVRLLPRGAGRRALPRDGRVGVGGRHRAPARRRGGSAPCNACIAGRAASTRASSSTSSAATGSRTCSRRRRRCAR